MSIDHLQSHYGFTRMPFGRALAPGMLHRHASHAEAVARISWCISERALGVITGEVGAGKTVAIRAALAGLDNSRHTTIYLGNPAVGGRGLYGGIVTALGGVPRFHKAALIPQTTELLAAELDERSRLPVVVIDEAHMLSNTDLEACARCPPCMPLGSVGAGLGSGPSARIGIRAEPTPCCRLALQRLQQLRSDRHDPAGARTA